MVPSSQLSELQEQIGRYRDCSSPLATTVGSLCCVCYVAPLLSTIPVFLLWLLVCLFSFSVQAPFFLLDTRNFPSNFAYYSAASFSFLLTVLITPCLSLVSALLCLCQPSPSQTLLVVSQWRSYTELHLLTRTQDTWVWFLQVFVSFCDSASSWHSFPTYKLKLEKKK